MKRASDTWRSDVLGLALSLEEDLLELDHIRPANETSGTLEVLVQGLVRSWRDAGFSQDEISRAFQSGSRNDFDIDPAWQDQRLQKQAWAEASSGRIGKALEQVQAWSASTALLALLAFIVVTVVGLDGLPHIVSGSLIFGGIVLAIGAGRILGWRKTRRLAALKQGVRSPAES